MRAGLVCGLRRLSASALLLLAAAAGAAEVTVMISAAYFPVYEQLRPAFEQASGHRLLTVRGPSMGDSPEAIPTRLARGEAADVVIMDRSAAEALAGRGLLRPASVLPLARSLIGMVVPAGAPRPDIGSVDAFRQVLLAAPSLAYSDSASGVYLSQTLFARLGLAEALAGKSRQVRGPPAGEPVAAVVARREAAIGFQQVSELLHVEGVSFVGPLPDALQPLVHFAGGVAATAAQPEAASALLRFLAAPAHRGVLEGAGLLPL